MPLIDVALSRKIVLDLFFFCMCKYGSIDTWDHTISESTLFCTMNKIWKLIEEKNETSVDKK